MRGALVVLWLLMAACSRERYPGDWGPRVPAGVAPAALASTPVVPRDCPWLGGAFRDAGIGKGPPVRLGPDALGVGEAERGAFDSTELGRTVHVTQFGDDSLVVTVLAPADTEVTPRERRVLSRAAGDYACSAASLERAWWDGHSGEGVLAATRVSVRLERAADGALVLRRRETGAGIMLLFPVALREEWWYRFMPAGPSNGGAP